MAASRMLNQRRRHFFIETEADSLEGLHRENRDAVHCHFEEG